MSSKERKRIYFFSVGDLSVEHYLLKAEPILRNFDSTKKHSLNDIIELYHITQYLDNDLFPPRRIENDEQQFKDLRKSIWETISKFWKNIDNLNFINLFQEIEVGYKPAFWQLMEIFTTYKNISKECFEEVLKHNSFSIWDILNQKKLINHFGEIIKTYMLNYDLAAEILLKKYEESSFSKSEELYIPNCLSLSDKEQIILNYLKSDKANLNYVRLIVQSTDRGLQISSTTRLQAMKLEEKLNDEIFEYSYISTIPTQLMIVPEQLEPVLITTDDGIRKISYGYKWLEIHTDVESLFHVFTSLFNYTDIFGSITLYSKRSELDLLEKIVIKGKNEYLYGMAYLEKNNLAYAQLNLFSNYLENNNNSIEELISRFVNEILVGKYGLLNLRFFFPSKSSTFLEKIRFLLPETESLLKQFKLFSETLSIEHELLEISSNPLFIGSIPSLTTRKYVYGTGEKFEELCFHFFSDQSFLWNIEPFKRKYNNLYALLKNENVKLGDFEVWQQDTINKLISEGILFINQNGHVKFWDELFIFIIGLLHHNEFVCYWSFSEVGRSIIDYMHEKGLIYFGDTLFSEPETKYLNYHLNKKEFSNSLDLRNKYSHGTNPNNEVGHKKDYYTVLKVLILILLKIEHDLIIFEVPKVKELK